MSTVQIIKYIAGDYQTNVYLVYDSDFKDCFIVDPGYEFIDIYNDIEKLNLKPTHILLTHSHTDHIGGVSLLKLNYPDIKTVLCEKCTDIKADGPDYMGVMGDIESDITVKDGDIFNIGDIEISVIATPGHTQDGCCYLLDDEEILFSGDTLFYESIGRTDFPGGDRYQLVNNIKTKLLSLRDSIRVYPGHGYATSIGNERRYNPFV